MLTPFIRNTLIVVSSVFGSVSAIFFAMIFSPPTEIFPLSKLYFLLFTSIFFCLASLAVLFVMAKKSNTSEDMDLWHWLLSGLLSTFFLIALLTYLLINTFREEFL